ncbi:kinase-like domain-containing protein, partial [Helicostylum pulchrum]
IMPKVDLVSVPTTKSTKAKDPKDTPEEREQRTIREMAIMRLLRHPNICQLKEYIAEGDKYYMFLEYVDGGQLLDYIIKHGKLREKQARKFARQISEQLKIIDFGLSNVYSPTQQLNTFCGSLYFAAPELLKAKEYTGPEVDVWSFGVVLYVLVCGRVPFDDTNLPALHEKIKTGLVEEYPDHLGKDCLDLLSKIFVVNPKERITLSGIQAHPWMNKGHEEPIRNYLPHRQPLESIDMEIVNGMHGFGLGSPEEIHQKLQRIVSSSAYQVAALKIDQNFQKKANDDQTLASRPKWRRTLSTRRKIQMHDDFQSLPAMYDPLVSIYYLVKERKESDERKKQLLSTESSPITLSRSTSTLVASTHLASEPGTSLVRRRTFDASKKLPELPAFQPKSKKYSNSQLSPADLPTPTASKSENIPVRKTTSEHPKSLFHFNRAQLFRITPDKLMTDLQKVLQQLQVETKAIEQFTLQCSCVQSVWSKFIKPNDDRSRHIVLEFTVMVYEARWAGGKIGFKVKEEQHQHNNVLVGLYTKRVLKSINSILLNEIGHLYHEVSP